MSKFVDLTGKRFNRLIVVERLENADGGITVWKCLCDCGNYTIVRGKNLKNGSVKSCGCLRNSSENKGTHNMSKTRLYNIYNGMIQRCENQNSMSYKNYGARGIKICKTWRNSFESFAKWAEKSGYKEGLTIDRKNVNGNYSPQNCQWITKVEQSKNRTSNVKITYNGETHNLTDWCRILNLDYWLIRNRIYKLGWNFEKAIGTPVQKSKRNMKARKKYANNSD